MFSEGPDRGQFITRMRVVGAPRAFSFALGIPVEGAKIALRRVPWKFAKKLCVEVFVISKDGDVKRHDNYGTEIGSAVRRGKVVLSRYRADWCCQQSTLTGIEKVLKNLRFCFYFRFESRTGYLFL